MSGFASFIREVRRDEVLTPSKSHEPEKPCTFWRRISLICGSESNNIIGDRDGRGENEVGQMSQQTREVITVKRSLSQEELDLFSKRDPNVHLSFPPISARGFRAASYQWIYPERATWCEIPELHFVGTFLTTWWLQLDKNVPESCIAVITRKLQIREQSDGNLEAVFLQVATIEEQRQWRSISAEQRKACFEDHAFTDRLTDELTRLSRLYSCLGHCTPQILLLRIHHAHLNLFATFLSVYTFHYLSQRMRGFSRVADFNLHKSSLKALAKDSSRTQLIASLGNNLVATTESLLETVAIDSALSHQLKLVAVDIRGSISEIRASLGGMEAEVSQGLRHATMQRDLEQSKSLRILTLLATFFLPMSLAAGVLSMQTRFKDLKVLLYDFFGVTVFAVALAFVLVGLLYGYIATSKRVRKVIYGSRFDDPKAKNYRNAIFGSQFSVAFVLFKLRFIHVYAMCVLLVYFVFSFAIGMFGSVRGGVVSLGISIFLTGMFLCFLWTLSLPGEQDQQHDRSSSVTEAPQEVE